MRALSSSSTGLNARVGKVMAIGFRYLQSRTASSTRPQAAVLKKAAQVCGTRESLGLAIHENPLKYVPLFYLCKKSEEQLPAVPKTQLALVFTAAVHTPDQESRAARTREEKQFHSYPRRSVNEGKEPQWSMWKWEMRAASVQQANSGEGSSSASSIVCRSSFPLFCGVN